MPAKFLCFQGEFFRTNVPFMGANRAFLYGDGVFESMRSVGPKVPLLSMHLDRLKASLDALRIKTENDFYKGIESAILETLKINSMTQGARIRLTVFRSGAGKYEPIENRPTYLIEVEEGSPAFELNKKGLSIDIAKDSLIYPTPYSSMKLIGSHPYILASIERKESKADELILLNDRGELVEACSSNLFLVKGKKVYTPPLSSGCLNGVMRAYVKGMVSKFDHQLVEKVLFPNDLEDSDEIFLTNAVNGVSWVASYKKRRFFNSFSKRIISQLKAL